MTKTILFTGATDGIGLATVEKLVAQGHHLLIHGRNTEKLRAVENKLSELEAGSVESYQADLSNLLKVDAFAKAVSDKYSHVDVIFNNAGVFKTQAPITDDKLDVRFVVNTLAPYLLTKRLLPLMNETGRIVNLSSAAQAPVDIDAMQGKRHIDDQFSVYAQSKLAITMWSRHLAFSLGSKSPAIISVNPGSMLASKMVKEGFGAEGKDIGIGVDILIRAGFADEFSTATGQYFDNDLGDFSQPHPDGVDSKKCEVLVDAIESILNRFIEL
jgi:NAD(P)-dependent dehydrogenase (short-subunit alcohol dehydrogenase family)